MLLLRLKEVYPSLDISLLKEEFGRLIRGHPDINATDEARKAPSEAAVKEGAIVPVVEL